MASNAKSFYSTFNSSNNSDLKNTNTIESLRMYSATSKLNKTISISANDLIQSPKTLKLPPVVNNNLNNNINSINNIGINSNSKTVLIGGSTGNLNTFGMSENLGKKKVNDLNRYCYFCQKKTGLASSYICRFLQTKFDLL